MKAFPYNHHEGMELGMDLRDYFAAKAMQSLIISSVTAPGKIASTENISKCAYTIADVMMEARKK